MVEKIALDILRTRKFDIDQLSAYVNIMRTIEKEGAKQSHEIIFAAAQLPNAVTNREVIFSSEALLRTAKFFDKLVDDGFLACEIQNGKPIYSKTEKGERQNEEWQDIVRDW